MKVEVYRNLRWKGVTLYSVRNKQTGKVEGHGEDILLRDVTFNVRKGGRARVLREKRKNVHAFVVGELLAQDTPDLEFEAGEFEGEWVKVLYDPYRFESFVLEDETPVTSALVARVGSNGVFAILSSPETQAREPSSEPQEAARGSESL